MFELPAVLPQDNSQVAAKYNARSSFKAMEIEEIQQILNKTHPTPEMPRLVEKITLKAYLKEVQDIEEYIGLVSHTVYGADGSVVGDTFSESNANSVGAKIHPKSLREAQQSTYEEVAQLKSMSSTATQVVAWHHGLDVLPRNTCKPEVYMDSLVTQKFVHEARSGILQSLGSDATKVLKRSNYRAPFGLKYCRYDDHWSNRTYLRRRSLHVMISIMYNCLERRDYERAWKAMTSLMREKHVDIRFLWRPALELLAWHETVDTSSKTPEEFLNWLILNFPKLPQTRAHIHRNKPNSLVFMPVSIMIKLANKNYAEALSQADQALNSAQYANNATCWALSGLAKLKLGHENSTVVQCFQKCLELGGVLPSSIHKQASKMCRSSSMRDVFDEYSDSSDSDTQSYLKRRTSEESFSSAKRAKLIDIAAQSERDASDSSDSEENAEPPSSQPFYSQAQTLGAEFGGSDSDDDGL